MFPFRLSARLQPHSAATPAVAAVAHAAVATVAAGGAGAGGPGAGGAGAGGAGAPAREVSRNAVVVPWRVSQRSRSGIIEVENTSALALDAVRFSLAGCGLLGVSSPRTVLPGERLRVVLRGTRAEAAAGASDALLVLRWFQADGRELLWPISVS